MKEKTAAALLDLAGLDARIDRLEKAVNLLIEETASNRSVQPLSCGLGYHQWNWLGGGRTFCRRCGLETHP